MTALDVILNVEGTRQDALGKKIHHTSHFAVGGLPAGMESGDPSVAVMIDLDDGSYVFAETSLKLFLTAADALKAHYGDPRFPQEESHAG